MSERRTCETGAGRVQHQFQHAGTRPVLVACKRGDTRRLEELDCVCVAFASDQWTAHFCRPLVMIKTHPSDKTRTKPCRTKDQDMSTCSEILVLGQTTKSALECNLDIFHRAHIRSWHICVHILLATLSLECIQFAARERQIEYRGNHLEQSLRQSRALSQAFRLTCTLGTTNLA